MVTINPQFITDSKGNKISVVLSIQEFKNIVEELEELEDVKLYDEAKDANEPSIHIDEAFKTIEANRNKKH